MSDQNEYPTEKELQIIEKWEMLEKPVRDLLEFVRSIWWMPEWGYKLKGKKVLYLELHTGGWSGNESIIHALKSNRIFWLMCWEKSSKGGHYYFKIRDPKPLKNIEV